MIEATRNLFLDLVAARLQELVQRAEAGERYVEWEIQALLGLARPLWQRHALLVLQAERVRFELMKKRRERRRRYALTKHETDD